jgi:hypothetical protein
MPEDLKRLPAEEQMVLFAAGGEGQVEHARRRHCATNAFRARVAMGTLTDRAMADRLRPLGGQLSDEEWRQAQRVAAVLLWSQWDNVRVVATLARRYGVVSLWWSPIGLRSEWRAYTEDGQGFHAALAEAA